jgi:hypothetical protein
VLIACDEALDELDGARAQLGIGGCLARGSPIERGHRLVDPSPVVRCVVRQHQCVGDARRQRAAWRLGVIVIWLAAQIPSADTILERAPQVLM